MPPKLTDLAIRDQHDEFSAIIKSSALSPCAWACHDGPAQKYSGEFPLENATLIVSLPFTATELAERLIP